MKKLICVLFLIHFTPTSFAAETTINVKNGVLKIGAEILITHLKTSRGAYSYIIGEIIQIYEDHLEVKVVQRGSGQDTGILVGVQEESYDAIDFRCDEESKSDKCRTERALSFIKAGKAVYTDGTVIEIR